MYNIQMGGVAAEHETGSSSSELFRAEGKEKPVPVSRVRSVRDTACRGNGQRVTIAADDDDDDDDNVGRLMFCFATWHMVKHARNHFHS